MEPRWLEWAKRLQAMAQDGITYTKDHYDVERYTALREVAAEIIAYHAEADLRSH
jgi:Hydrolase of X-linked nucleoside diphosphate N terminal